MSTAKINLSELKEICISALQDKGATRQEAEIVYGDYLDAELRGRASHGFAGFDAALSAFPHKKYEIIEHLGSILVIEGNGDCGHVVAREAIDIALEKLGQRKIYSIGIRNITRFNSPGLIARYAAQKGSFAIVLEYGGGNFMIPYGGKTAALSTNPIGIAIPGTKPLFVLDISLSEKAFYFVKLAEIAGESIPDTWAVDKDGKPVTDPSAVSAVRPFGGYKGFGLALAFEILAGILVGVGVGTKGNLAKRGAQIFLIDPTIYGHTAESFSEQVTNFLKEVTSSPSLDPNKSIVYPGQLSDERSEKIIRTGQVELPTVVIEKLRSL